MKRIVMSKALRKLLILSLLIAGFVFVAFDNQTSRTASAAWICCSDCPVVPGSEVSPFDYCANQCGVRSGTCYDQCLNGVYFCWQHCNYCEGNGCSYDWECAEGLQCLGGMCSL